MTHHEQLYGGVYMNYSTPVYQQQPMYANYPPTTLSPFWTPAVGYPHVYANQPAASSAPTHLVVEEFVESDSSHAVVSSSSSCVQRERKVAKKTITKKTPSHRSGGGGTSKHLAINAGFERLQEIIPHAPAGQRLAKIKTLRLATSYIQHLQSILNNPDDAQTPSSKYHHHADHFAHIVEAEVQSRNTYKHRAEVELARERQLMQAVVGGRDVDKKSGC